MKPIKNLTYHNFMRVAKMISAKGYDEETSYRLAHRIFDEANPNGMSILDMVDRILPKEEFDRLYA